MEYLKENAEYFEKKAREAFEEGVYNFTLFFAEQALQLYIKYILVKTIGDYPKTHSFSTLFQILAEIIDSAYEFYDKYSELFELLEDAYITVRYFGRKYSKTTAEKILRLIDEFKEVFDKWL
ncbi:MAG: hypothetical protein B6U89_05705 [Desulfurococcales archaeon ex4484_58]|nr:MAG: hypothetical protein B6U89_05705 [Desulfurococcales archaeon ex4484_58]